VLVFMMAAVALGRPEMSLLGRVLKPALIATHIVVGHLFNAVPPGTTTRRTS
jgi:hypothetical protein